MYKRISESLDPTVKVFGQPYLDFTDFVEQGLINPRKIQEMAYGYLKPINKRKVNRYLNF